MREKVLLQRPPAQGRKASVIFAKTGHIQVYLLSASVSWSGSQVTALPGFLQLWYARNMWLQVQERSQMGKPVGVYLPLPCEIKFSERKTNVKMRAYICVVFNSVENSGFNYWIVTPTKKLVPSSHFTEPENTPGVVVLIYDPSIQVAELDSSNFLCAYMFWALCQIHFCLFLLYTTPLEWRCHRCLVLFPEALIA